MTDAERDSLLVGIRHDLNDHMRRTTLVENRAEQVKTDSDRHIDQSREDSKRDFDAIANHIRWSFAGVGLLLIALKLFGNG